MKTQTMIPKRTLRGRSSQTRHGSETLTGKQDSITCADLLKPVEEVVGNDHMLWPDGGYVNGSSQTEVKAVMVTWMADVTALQKAAASGCNVVLCHESSFYSEKHELPPYRWLNAENDCAEREWHPNSRRRALIGQHKLTVMQCHYGFDRFPIYDSFVETLELKTVFHKQGWDDFYSFDNAPVGPGYEVAFPYGF